MRQYYQLWLKFISLTLIEQRQDRFQSVESVPVCHVLILSEIEMKLFSWLIRAWFSNSILDMHSNPFTGQSQNIACMCINLDKIKHVSFFIFLIKKWTKNKTFFIVPLHLDWISGDVHYLHMDVFLLFFSIDNIKIYILKIRKLPSALDRW